MTAAQRVCAVMMVAALPAAAYDCSKLSLVTTKSPDSCTAAGLADPTVDDVQSCVSSLCSNPLLKNYYQFHIGTAGYITKAGVGGCKVETQKASFTDGFVCTSASSGGSGSSSGLTGGGVFLIIFFVGGFVYFTAGIAYNYFAKGLRGTEVVPHKAFWTDLPWLVKDGAVFLKNKVTGGGGSYTSL